ncbi:hypothetical protein COW36_09155 [bacterium (Candidatus Blackallbacteria) CG17_big_fil_post_rev_8_21_14_2_50_48_46]|uniref:Uncharacterized protein n=1 Tax=bacterium (Candidatus Blackallbacteria) CG17_big_fil_post_rev_8_21_14_2_50_48_46 TaxID=2014261 RepID=A0A2M7G5N2_9BACT|nr:MAG: hypothetical protein COW64_23895 [bacterium (Candidatus Blackallbacteria) CG18_big_fil_WC_8_21_14_2_50_49_26]PIW17333.1 MAG: hypothetical protein COW36_09155 [bacterium (Candidatus Blackallbacteria) CG17_big_fil_post_rev_8_21_14_2_50_48_46]PIW47435.1 MAG: hypothetical protein COW20_12675 [bacterium (Candidatus Blackallbacteria) CG13_big_fil_rev_8_21_14_2_50_49_14]
MKGKKKDLCERCRRWTDCSKSIYGRDFCPVCFECETEEIRILSEAKVPFPFEKRQEEKEV